MAKKVPCHDAGRAIGKEKIFVIGRLFFKPGAEFIFRNSKATIKMVVVLTDYFSFKKPTVSFYIKDFDADHPNSKSLNETFNIFLKNCIEEQNRKARDLL
jgi:hypothetical protein